MDLIFPKLANVEGFAPESKVWLYVADRPLAAAETARAEAALQSFAKQWTAHNQALQAAAEVFQNRILVLMVDETRAGASGCSIDTSVHFLEALGREMGLDFFERMVFFYIDADNVIRAANREEFGQKILEGIIGPQTLVLNNLADHKRALLEQLWIPFGKSWHQKLF